MSYIDRDELRRLLTYRRAARAFSVALVAIILLLTTLLFSASLSLDTYRKALEFEKDFCRGYIEANCTCN